MLRCIANFNPDINSDDAQHNTRINKVELFCSTGFALKLNFDGTSEVYL